MLSDVLKGESSHWINSEKLTSTHFAWQGGFGAFSVSESLVGKVRRYNAAQDDHHRKRSFTEEVEEFLRWHNAVYADDAKGCEHPPKYMMFSRKPDR